MSLGGGAAEAQGLAGDDLPVVGVFRLQLFKPSETFIASQAQALRRYRPLYIGRRAFGPPPPGAEVATLRRGWTQALRLMLLRAPEPLLDALGGRRPALLHAHFGVDAVYARPLARRLGVPLAVTLHGFDVSRRRRSMLASLRPALVHAVLGWSALVSDRVLLLGVSQAVVQAALRRGARRERLRLLPMGVDLARLAPSSEAEPGLEVPGLVVHVGRLVEKKGAAILLDAFADAARERADARLVVIGEGPERRRLEARARRLGVSERVRLMGALPHDATLDWLVRAAVVAVPSRVARNGDAEGLPTVLLEAAALGRAIVASDTPGVSEALRHDVEALLVAPGDAMALSAALRRLLDDPQLGYALGSAARRRVEARYDLQVQTRRLESCYDALLADRAFVR